ncbi:hypothetical protein M2306_001051 [Myroides gitamensis]|uniref:beta-1,6-N-acetylglucosaminyltransferase n=1 Tax=Myroides odoratus TaxID=256 RepID=UPI0021697419|nr:beta-1,6-N-acetylglucosaminyltransferase [Myroides odoratus]MCS4238708.1 hypothetical protein [Myroides odoratus]MDH6600357.1 hypothetical protein [Myroides gitamensis]
MAANQDKNHPQLKFETKNNTVNKLITVAYFITIKYNPDYFLTMFKKLYNKDQLYLIYIDHTCSLEVKNMIQTYVVHLSNVYILDSFYLQTDSYNKYKIQLNAMQYLLNVSAKWDYYINLTDDHYPLKSQYRICEYLSNNKEHNYFIYYDKSKYNLDTYNSNKHNYSGLIALKDAGFSKNTIIPYMSNTWLILTRDSCAFLSYSKLVDHYIELYTNSLLPSNSFFATILLNSDYKRIIINHDQRILFSKSEPVELILKKIKSNNHFFVRKMNLTSNSIIDKCIEDNYQLSLMDKKENKNELGLNSNQQN